MSTTGSFTLPGVMPLGVPSLSTRSFNLPEATNRARSLCVSKDDLIRVVGPNALIKDMRSDLMCPKKSYG